MSNRHEVGLRILMWLARHLLDKANVTPEEQTKLGEIATALTIVRYSDDR